MESPLQLALRAGGTEEHSQEIIRELRKLRNSAPVLSDLERLYSVTDTIERAMKAAYEGDNDTAIQATACPGKNGEGSEKCAMSVRPGNFHGVKSHSYYVGAISEAHTSLPFSAVQSIVASEWYHPGLTAKAVWCVEDCGSQFSVAHRLDANFDAIHREVKRFWNSPDAAAELAGVGSHTTQFDRLIAGNGTWVDVRLWRGRAFNKRLCERYFRVICSIVEASPEIWTNPWSHVLLSILLHDSWVPFHQGHTNGQLTYHLPITVPRKSGVAELAVVERGGTLPDDKASRGMIFTHPEEHIVRWKKGKTLVFDDSFTHAVRFRSTAPAAPKASMSSVLTGPGFEEARVVLLMRGWHPELETDERAAMREFIRRGGEEDPEGYEMLPVTPTVFGLY